MPLELEKLSEAFIGAAIAVHKELGPGFIESIYENSLKIECRDPGILAEFQKEVPVEYHGHPVGTHRIDIIIENQLVIELKAIKALEDVHFAQVRSYLRATKLKHGLLLNFASATLTVKRVL
jgi:GxxExxY protein